MLAEGSRISSLSRAKGFKEDTILSWLREAAQQAEDLEAVLMAEFKVKRGQLDALWGPTPQELTLAGVRCRSPEVAAADTRQGCQKKTSSRRA